MTNSKSSQKFGRLFLVFFVFLAVILIGLVGRNTFKSRFLFKTQLPQKATLTQIIDSRQTWDPAFISWYDKPVPDVNLTDINGKNHVLSQYRGKKVLIVFWTTWCPACNTEIPFLIELRNSFTADQLVMLAVSNEDVETLKSFVESRKINYTVISAGTPMPSPFGDVTGIPAGFFIDSEGKIKLVTEGLVSLNEIKAILNIMQ